MKNSKGESISNLIFGLVFLAIGILLLLMKSDLAIVNIIAAADMLLGLALLGSGVIGMLKKGNDAEPMSAPERAPRRKEENEWDKPAKKEHAADDWDIMPAPVPVPRKEEEPEEEPVEFSTVPETVESLSAREAELRKVVRRRRADARQAAEAAEQAAAAAAAAEKRLVNAENSIRQLQGEDKRAALARVDRLADEAMDLSQKAAIAARKAKNAEISYKKALEEHRIAMDAAAEAMAAAEDESWN